MNFYNVKKVKSKRTGKMWIIFEGDVNLDMKKKTVDREIFGVNEDDEAYAQVLKATGL